MKDMDFTEGKGLRVSGSLNRMNYVDTSRDRIRAGAWSKTVRDLGPEGANRLRYLAQHDMAKPLAKFTELEEKGDDLHFVAQIKASLIKDVQHVRETALLIQEGVIDENSVGFRVVNGYYNDKEDVYEMTECKLFEGSAVTLADNDLARISEVKDAGRIAKIIDGITKVLKRGSISDSTALQLEARLTELKSALRPQQNEPAPEPRHTEALQALKTLHQTIKITSSIFK